MKIKLIISLILMIIITVPAFAQKTPVKITPVQIISTHHDEVEVGDIIKFQVVNDVYVDDKLYLKKGSYVFGIVDFVHNNGWAGDSAEIKFNKFITQNINGEKITITYPIDLVGNIETANISRQLVIAKQLLYEFSMLIRGSEVLIEPDSMYVNIFITQ